MTKLQELRALSTKAFENATSKDEIEKSAELKAKIDEVEKEFEGLEKKNAELVTAYKQVVKNTSFKEHTDLKEQVEPKTAPTLEEHLKWFLENHKEEK